jgi:hypothetical protein
MTGTGHLTQVRAQVTLPMRANCRRQDGVRHSAHEISTRKRGLADLHARGAGYRGSGPGLPDGL